MEGLKWEVVNGTRERSGERGVRGAIPGVNSQSEGYIQVGARIALDAGEGTDKQTV